jgi:hypothetical protein
MSKALCVVLVSLGLAACGGESGNATGNPEVPSNINRTNTSP